MPEIKNRTLLTGREYIGVDKIDGALVFAFEGQFLHGVVGAGQGKPEDPHLFEGPDEKIVESEPGLLDEPVQPSDQYLLEDKSENKSPHYIGGR